MNDSTVELCKEFHKRFTDQNDPLMGAAFDEIGQAIFFDNLEEMVAAMKTFNICKRVLADAEWRMTL